MRIVLFSCAPDSPPSPGIVVEDGVVDIGSIVGIETDPQDTMRRLIARYDRLRPEIEALAHSSERVPVESVRLWPPVPRPGKILCAIANYWEHAQREPRPLNMFLKNPDAVIGPGDTVVLPEDTEPWMFMHEAELAIVARGPSKSVARRDWRNAVFGYTGLIDVTARGRGRLTWRPVSWLGKSFDTFAPVGPCIVTADEIEDPADLQVRLWVNGALRHNYSTDDMEHPVAALVEFASAVMTLDDGDLIACGTNHEGLGPIQDGDLVELEIERIGRMAVTVSDPLGRSWDRGVYAGADSTNRELVRHRPR
jgi:2-keto-4-pentenoate hydratase/2-oxohepta-3-ene-1,7-dioic acid hydratase in catechol pathway